MIDKKLFFCKDLVNSKKLLSYIESIKSNGVIHINKNCEK